MASLRRPNILVVAGITFAVFGVVIGLLFASGAARALPPAGTDHVYVSADVSVASRIGTETIHFTGLVTIVRQNPRLESGAQVADLQITSLNLTGDSLEGTVTASQSTTTSSTGQIRSINPSPSEYPATSFFDVFVDVEVPASPSPTLTLHNDTPIHLVATSNINSWPPYGVKYQLQLSVQPTPTATPTQSPPPGTPPCTNGVPLSPGLPAKVCVTNVTLMLSAPSTDTDIDALHAALHADADADGRCDPRHPDADTSQHSNADTDGNP